MIKTARVLLWLIAAITWPLSIKLLIASQSIDAFISGSVSALQDAGQILFIIAVVITCLNLTWGITRWLTRYFENKWSVGRVIGKFIGGGIWRFLAITPIVVVSYIFIAPVIKNQIISQVEVARTEAQSEFRLASDYWEEISSNIDNMSQEELLKVLGEMTLSNVEFSTDASGNISTRPTGLFSQNAYAAADVQTLNKAVLSSNSHFIVFFTDTGDQKISQEKAIELGEMMEGLIDAFYDTFGFTYRNQEALYHTGFMGGKLADIQAVMEANGISSSFTFTAMPIYVVNPYDENGPNAHVLASYAGQKFNETLNQVLLSIGDLLGEESSEFYGSAPLLPFINILPENVEQPSLELVAAHEFGHHYNSQYCYDHFAESCNDNNFVDETIPNYMAVKSVSSQPENNLISGHYNGWYIDVLDKKIDDDEAHHGYGSFAFLWNYSQFVENGEKYIFDALVEDDAYTFLYNKAGKNAMREVLTAMAEKNLTNDYGNATMVATSAPRQSLLPCKNLCSQTYDTDFWSWDSSTAHYFYAETEDYKNVELTLSYKMGNAYNISLLGKRNGAWQVISTPPVEWADETVYYHFIVKDYAEDYDTLAIVVVDYAAPGETASNLQISSVEIEEEVPVEELELIQSPFLIEGNCVKFYTNDLMDFASNFMGIFLGIDGLLDTNISEFQNQTDLAKQNGNFKVSFCESEIKMSYDTVKQMITKGSWVFKIFEHNQPNEKILGVIQLDPVGSKAMARFLVSLDGASQLVTITTEEATATSTYVTENDSP